jgi:hypothetical protein
MCYLKELRVLFYGLSHCYLSRSVWVARKSSHISLKITAENSGDMRQSPPSQVKKYTIVVGMHECA